MPMMSMMPMVTMVTMVSGQDELGQRQSGARWKV
jgi:hypothetical protein